MNIKKLENNINSFWDSKITPVLIDYIKIPNKSNFNLGIPGCDNYIAYLLSDEGEKQLKYVEYNKDIHCKECPILKHDFD